MDLGFGPVSSDPLDSVQAPAAETPNVFMMDFQIHFLYPKPEVLPYFC